MYIPRFVVFSDLDGTLLDQHTYSFKAAIPAIRGLRKRNIPLVLCTSKTRAETLLWWKAMGLSDPFVVENGGAIVIPKGYFGPITGPTKEVKGMSILVLGTEYERLLEGLQYLKGRMQGNLRGFSDMGLQEISEQTGLPLRHARLAKQREFDEPFIFVRDEVKYAPKLPLYTRELDLSFTHGGRFYHLHGDTHKGKAVQRLQELYRKKLGRFRSIGIGDSGTDLMLLKVVDLRIIIQRPNGQYDPQLRRAFPRARFSPKPGPLGWNMEISNLLLRDT
jgi:mannosyl-3-phosphoglycerate phosphatase